MRQKVHLLLKARNLYQLILVVHCDMDFTPKSIVYVITLTQCEFGYKTKTEMFQVLVQALHFKMCVNVFCKDPKSP